MTITPAYLREVADGLANQNSHYERVAARFAASADLEQSVKELGKLLSDVTHGGQFNHHIARALERARDALRRRQ